MVLRESETGHSGLYPNDIRHHVTHTVHEMIIDSVGCKFINFDEDKGHPRWRWVCRSAWNPSLAHRILRGATCSGKTTLAKHLNCTLPDSVIIHQDVRVSTIHLPSSHAHILFRTLPLYVTLFDLFVRISCPSISPRSSSLCIPFIMFRTGTPHPAPSLGLASSRFYGT